MALDIDTSKKNAKAKVKSFQDWLAVKDYVEASKITYDSNGNAVEGVEKTATTVSKRTNEEKDNKMIETLNAIVDDIFADIFKALKEDMVITPAPAAQNISVITPLLPANIVSPAGPCTGAIPPVMVTIAPIGKKASNGSKIE